jgi:asparagine synthase (glutamine-hydrolysing)
VDVLGQLVGRAPLNQSLYIWAKTMMPHNMLQFAGDRSEMAHSVEGRVPYLDHRVVELARDLPVTLKIRGTTEKFILREAVKPFVTDTVYRRQKHPFAAPPTGSLVTSKLYALTQDTLRSSVLGSVPFFDQKAVLSFLDKLPTMSDADRIVWNVPLMRMMGACFLQARYQL